MDGGVRDAVRLPHLQFDAPEDAARSPIWRSTTTSSPRSRSLCDRLGVVRIAGSVARWRPGKRVAELGLGDGRTRHARASRSRPTARARSSGRSPIFPAYGWDYDQSGIVATIAHEYDHEGVAEQHFLPAGPFAILPLPGRQSSIVWNERRADARALVALDPEDFVRQLELRFTPKLGEISAGLAGRGVPVPLPGGAPLRRRAAGARRRRGARRPPDRRPGPEPGPARRRGAGRDDRRTRCGSGSIRARPAALADYQRARRFDVAASGMGMDLMNRLFSNDFGPLRFVRDLGLRLVDRAPRLKDRLIVEAGGRRERTRRGCCAASRCERALSAAHARRPGARQHRRGDAAPLVPPIHLSSTFLRDPDNLYRSGNVYGRPDNETVREAEAVIGALEGAAETLVFGSGMSAAIALFLSLGAGAHVVAPTVMYWALRNWLAKDAARLRPRRSISSTRKISPRSSGR